MRSRSNVTGRKLLGTLVTLPCPYCKYADKSIFGIYREYNSQGKNYEQTIAVEIDAFGRWIMSEGVVDGRHCFGQKGAMR
ncbi:MAG: hypothetical protein ACK6EB_14925 [Planctomyces sp.]